MKKPELLAPAGNLEKLKMACLYGADAVYLGGERFGLRTASDNFTQDEMAEGVAFAHARGVLVYVTVNIIPHNDDLPALPAFLQALVAMGVDAVIVADLGVFMMVKEFAPQLDIHISTQANNTNWRSACAWASLGAKRVVVARELSLTEIALTREKLPEQVEIEAFVHGAMCISYSGRCLLSNYMTGRDANKGECAHPCRWKYYLMEEKRPGEYMPVYEDERGTFIYNAKDLCMIEHIPALIQAGITSFKIEGRVKSAYYVATVVRAYRKAIDAYMANPKQYTVDRECLEEVQKVSHRAYTTGFYFGKPTGNEQIYTTSSYIREYDIIGLILDYDATTGIATVEQRNRFFVGDTIEILSPDQPVAQMVVTSMQNAEGESITVAPHPQMTLKIPMDMAVTRDTILRKQGL
ncbi:MAG: U32 family peptidase [Hyphomonadaceae bacterium]|nr:U32 family peptidase [Clostridia bacterium]